MEMDGAALTGFAAPLLKGFAKNFPALPFSFLKKWGRDLGFFLSFGVGQLLTSKIGRGDNASPSFGSRCHVIYSLIYLFSGSEAERFSAALIFFSLPPRPDCQPACSSSCLSLFLRLAGIPGPLQAADYQMRGVGID